MHDSHPQAQQHSRASSAVFLIRTLGLMAPILSSDKQNNECSRVSSSDRKCFKQLQLLEFLSVNEPPADSPLFFVASFVHSCTRRFGLVIQYSNHSLFLLGEEPVEQTDVVVDNGSTIAPTNKSFNAFCKLKFEEGDGTEAGKLIDK